VTVTVSSTCPVRAARLPAGPYESENKIDQGQQGVENLDCVTDCKVLRPQQQSEKERIKERRLWAGTLLEGNGLANLAADVVHTWVAPLT
jgi:hypothetical protein